MPHNKMMINGKLILNAKHIRGRYDLQSRINGRPMCSVKILKCRDS